MPLPSSLISFSANTLIKSADVNSNFNTLYTTLTNTVLYTDVARTITVSNVYSAPQKFADGTAALPSITFNSGPTNGWYYIGTNELGMALNGAKTIDFATTSTTFLTDLLFTDGLYDIGKSGATRPRDGFFSRNFTLGGNLRFTGTSSAIITPVTSLVIRDSGDANTNVTLTDAGNLTLARGTLYFSLAASRITPGATSLTVFANDDVTANLVLANGGDFTISRGRLVFGAAASVVTPGATSWALTNTANSANNVLVTDAGLVTLRNTLTIAQGNANTGILSSTGYSLTGTSAVGMVSYSGTWNTTGVPTAFSIAITNTVSGSGALLMNLLAGVGGATSMFSVDKVGAVLTGSTINGQTISAAAVFTGTVTIAGNITLSGTTQRILGSGTGTSWYDAANANLNLGIYDTGILYLRGVGYTGGASAGEMVFNNAKHLRAVNAAGNANLAMIGTDSSNRIVLDNGGNGTWFGGNPGVIQWGSANGFAFKNAAGTVCFQMYDAGPAFLRGVGTTTNAVANDFLLANAGALRAANAAGSDTYHLISLDGSNVVQIDAGAHGTTVSGQFKATSTLDAIFSGTVDVVLGTSVGTNYNHLYLSSGGSQTYVNRYRQTAIAGVAKTIAVVGSMAGALLHVVGSDGGNTFSDVLNVGLSVTPNVINSLSTLGSPTGRTYSNNSGSVQLVMASGTYTVHTTFIGMPSP